MNSFKLAFSLCVESNRVRLENNFVVLILVVCDAVGFLDLGKRWL